ncbi:hypothetical protein ACQPU1_06310 [Clostridium paraputrificum]|uniref:hypothetical protein n=1 Tax=Clostridium paraputrificum TaxID=29363 RepID=UPI003D3527D6
MLNKKIKSFIGFGIIIIITSINIIGCSKESDLLQVSSYFPIDKSIVYEFEGTQTDKQTNEIKEIATQFEQKGKSQVSGKDVYTRKETYFDDLKNNILEYEVYFNYDNEGNIYQLGRKVNGEIELYDTPGVYLHNANIGDIYETIDGDTIEIKAIEDLNIDDKVYDNCILVEKNFYDEKKLERKEQLYLQKDFGLIKYVEESFTDDYKIKLNYKNK